MVVVVIPVKEIYVNPLKLAAKQAREALHILIKKARG